MSQDNTFYEEVRRLTQTENTATKELIEKMVVTLLTNCNNGVTLMQAADVIYNYIIINLIINIDFKKKPSKSIF